MDWKSIVNTVAPVLGFALAGPLGGAATKMIANTLLDDEDATESEIAAAVANATPEQLGALKKAEMDFEVRMKEAGVDLAQINAADRDSARKREIATGDYTPKLLALAVTVGFFGLLGAMTKLEIPVANREILFIMIGALGASFGAVIQYYFGSSDGSKQKNSILAEKIAPAVPAAPKNTW